MISVPVTTRAGMAMLARSSAGSQWCGRDAAELTSEAGGCVLPQGSHSRQSAPGRLRVLNGWRVAAEAEVSHRADLRLRQLIGPEAQQACGSDGGTCGSRGRRHNASKWLTSASAPTSGRQYVTATHRLPIRGAWLWASRNQFLERYT